MNETAMSIWLKPGTVLDWRSGDKRINQIKADQHGLAADSPLKHTMFAEHMYGKIVAQGLWHESHCEKLVRGELAEALATVRAAFFSASPTGISIEMLDTGWEKRTTAVDCSATADLPVALAYLEQSGIPEAVGFTLSDPGNLHALPAPSPNDRVAIVLAEIETKIDQADSAEQTEALRDVRDLLARQFPTVRPSRALTAA